MIAFCIFEQLVWPGVEVSEGFNDFKIVILLKNISSPYCATFQGQVGKGALLLRLGTVPGEKYGW